MATIQQILTEAGYTCKGDNRNRAIRGCNLSIDLGIKVQVCKKDHYHTTAKGKTWTIKVSGFGWKRLSHVKGFIEPYHVLLVLAHFLQGKVRANIQGELAATTPHKCGKCDGKGVIPQFAYYANGVCFDCSGLGMTGQLNVSTKAKKQTPSRIVANYRVSGNYENEFPKNTTFIKQINGANETWGEVLSQDDKNYYIHQPICMANSWYCIPKVDKSKFFAAWSSFKNLTQ